MVKDLIGGVLGVADSAGDFIETSEERSEALNKRHLVDMNSDNRLSKAIRPIVTIFSGVVWGFVTVWAMVQGSVNWEVYGIASSPFLSCIGWYFESRKREKIAAQNVKGNIELEKLRVKSDLRNESKSLKAEIRSERRKERKQEREGTK